MTITVLIADDEPAARYAMKKALAKLDCELLEAEDGEQALVAVRERSPQLVFLDLDMPVLGGRQVLQALSGEAHGAEIVVVTASDALDAAVECIRLGAVDYFTKPYEIERLRAIVRRNSKRVATERRVGELRQQLDRDTACGALVGVSRPMRELFERLERAALAPLDILICGETGTGKELIARELHRRGKRADGPFVALNAAAVNESLAESELFGHIKGAFTGADRARSGVFEQADGGTLFLDEIGDMALPLQAKILRVLQQREVQPVGSSRSVAVDVRVVSATHQDLPQSVAAGDFREDLYYRLRGVELNAPPLRRRQEDVILLAEYFLEQLAQQAGDSEPKRLSEDAIRRLLAHHWPGNVRELQQAITAAGAMAPGAEISAVDLGLSDTASTGSDELPNLDGLPLSEAKSQLVEWFERRMIEQALTQNRSNVSAAARQLGIHRQSLQQKMNQLGISR